MNGNDYHLALYQNKMTKKTFLRKQEELRAEYLSSSAKFEVGETVMLGGFGGERTGTVLERWAFQHNQNHICILYKVEDSKLVSFYDGKRVPSVTNYEQKELKKIKD